MNFFTVYEFAKSRIGLISASPRLFVKTVLLEPLLAGICVE
jgi:hypothetical protein